MVGVGSRYETPDIAGVSHFVEHLVFKGTSKRPTPGEISMPVEGVGGILDAGTEHEMTDYWCKVAQPHLGECLDLLLDMLRNSLFDPDEMNRERLVVFEELNMLNDRPPSHKAETMMDELLWPDHPLGREIGGTRESVTAVSRDEVLAHVGTYYTPANLVVSVAGNIDHDDVVSQVENLSRDWVPQTRPNYEQFAHTQHEAALRVQYRRSEQAHASVAFPGVSMNDPDVYAVDLLNVILGEGMSSRLFQEVRERRGLAYDIHSSVVHFSDCGAFIVNAGVDPKRVYDTVETILAELATACDGVTEEELVQAKRLTAGRIMLGTEDTRWVAGWAGSQELLLTEVMSVDQVIAQVDQVSIEDVQRVADRLFATERLNVVVVGPVRGEAKLQRLLHL